MDYVAYYRVSTKRQGRSGLGLEAQQAAVNAFLESSDTIIAAFTEVVSGRKENREQLQKAMRLAKAKAVPLLIAKLDRFSRRVSFIASVMESGIQLTIAEMPRATEFQLHIFAALAQEERRLISERTKAALSQVRKRGKLLGQHGKQLALINRDSADQFAGSLAQHLPSDWATLSFSAIARVLNRKNVKTRTGSLFYPQTVKNYLARMSG
ncbi:recombinase family protein [Rhizobium sp. PL01]|uniref:recombinase family protein n=1 Tax=Rhizobium sp. PL01 TaxID=3085631 RepID=UPI00298129C8|nr:recombinase family protein [Rhizobium sp. PL01]MDW5318142.1 recombinase family protein [Rhizobium sp. PL01]